MYRKFSNFDLVGITRTLGLVQLPVELIKGDQRCLVCL